jgi:acyl-[acyl-carrier-protein] desaturase
MAFYRDVVKAHLDADPDYIGPLAAVVLGFEMPWSASVLGDFEERRSRLAARGVFRLTDYVDTVLQPLSLYWEIDRRTPQREEARQAQRQLRRYRAAVRKFARRETSDAEGRSQVASTTPTSRGALSPTS